MRVSHSSMTLNSIFLLGRNFSRMTEMQTQLSSGRRINSFADDPRGVGIAQRLSTIMADNEQYLRNLGSANSVLDGTETALREMADLMIRMRETVQRESSAVSDPRTRAASAAEVKGLRDQMLALANQQVRGSFLFGGFHNRTTPFVMENGVVSYQGDDGVQRVQVSPSLQLPTTLPGGELIGGSTATLKGFQDLLPRVTGTTTLAELNQGLGAAPGTIRIEDGFGAFANVDLSAATTVQDVLDAINATGLAVTARLSDDQTGITLDGSGPLSVGEINDGTTAASLGLLGSTASNALIGNDIRPELTDATPLTEVPALAGSLPLGSLRFRIDGVDTDVDLSAATNINDVRTAVGSLIPGMDVQINGGALSLVYNNPEPFQVVALPGDTTGDLLGLQGSGSPARLFEVFADVIAALESGDQRALAQTLSEVQDVHEGLLEDLVTVGTRQSLASRTEDIVRNRQISLERQRSDVVDVDLVDVATRLTFAETAYQAALSSSARLMNLSLMNFL